MEQKHTCLYSMCGLQICLYETAMHSSVSLLIVKLGYTHDVCKSNILDQHLFQIKPFYACFLEGYISTVVIKSKTYFLRTPNNNYM